METETQIPVDRPAVSVIDADLRETFAAMHRLVIGRYPFLSEYCYLSAYGSDGHYRIHIGGAGEIPDIHASSFRTALEQLENYDPEKLKRDRIAALEAELAELKGGAR